MLNALDPDARRGHAGQRIQQHAAQRIAQCLAKAALQRVDDKLAIAVVLADFHTFNFGFFDLIDHSAFPPLFIALGAHAPRASLAAHVASRFESCPRRHGSVINSY